jgi:hypothetical protein
MGFSNADLMGLVKFHMHDNMTRSEQWNRASMVYCGKAQDGLPAGLPDDEKVARNMAYEVADAMSSTLVPSKPELRISPNKMSLRDAARAQEGLVREAFRRDDIEGTFRRGITFASLHDYVAFKTVWNDRLQRTTYRAVEAKNFFFDRSAERWEDIRYCAEITTKPLSEIRSLTKKRNGEPGYRKHVVDRLLNGTHVPDWLRFGDDYDHNQKARLLETLQERVVVELLVFDRDGGPTKLYHLVPDIEEPLLVIDYPAHHLRNPWTLLTLSIPVEGLTGPSPYSLVRPHAAHLNQMESLRAATAKASIPVPIVDYSKLQNPSAFELAMKNARDPRDVIRAQMSGKGGARLADIIAYTQTPGTTIDFTQTVRAISTLIDSTLGLPSYLRAGNSNADFSAEIQMQGASLATRSGAKKKAINKAFVDMGIKTLQLYAERVGPEDLVYVRAAEGEMPEEITRDMADLNMFVRAAGQRPLEMDFEVRVVDDSTENPVVRLQAVQPILPVLLAWAQKGHADEAKLARRVLRWAGLEDAASADGTPVTPGMPAMPGAPGAPAGGAEVPGVSGGQSGVTGTQPPSVSLPPTT